VSQFEVTFKMTFEVTQFEVTLKVTFEVTQPLVTFQVTFDVTQFQVTFSAQNSSVFRIPYVFHQTLMKDYILSDIM
jgi:hypothetical protein